jgi:alkanesulfonate monooxygenase SsuD/methylene tetrahydromethanopterin reductase-like flavin-dependent oxidoreductase (luciferase family)
MDSLADKALGMVLPDCHVTAYEGQVTVTPLEKHLAPDTLAQIFWLKNRDPKNWSDRQEVHTTTTIAGLPESVMDRIRAAAKARAEGRPVVDVQEVKPKALPPAKPSPLPAQELDWTI